MPSVLTVHATCTNDTSGMYENGTKGLEVLYAPYTSIIT